MLILADYTGPSHDVEQMAPGLICETTNWGWALTGGYKVHLYRRWPAFPFIEREVVVLTVNQNANDADKTCSDALNQYTHG
jgi:hypothetical protein